MLSSSLEKCLMCMYHMQENDKELRSSELAKQMNQPLQKTIQALQRMHYQKLIIYSPYQPLKLTEEGKSMAEYLVARDALIEEFLGFLKIEKNLISEKEAMAQYLSNESLERIEKFVVLNRQYPEIAERFDVLLKITPNHILLPPLPNGEKKL